MQGHWRDYGSSIRQGIFTPTVWTMSYPSNRLRSCMHYSSWRHLCACTAGLDVCLCTCVWFTCVGTCICMCTCACMSVSVWCADSKYIPTSLCMRSSAGSGAVYLQLHEVVAPLYIYYAYTAYRMGRLLRLPYTGMCLCTYVQAWAPTCTLTWWTCIRVQYPENQCTRPVLLCDTEQVPQWITYVQFHLNGIVLVAVKPEKSN